MSVCLCVRVAMCVCAVPLHACLRAQTTAVGVSYYRAYAAIRSLHHSMTAPGLAKARACLVVWGVGCVGGASGCMYVW